MSYLVSSFASIVRLISEDRVMCEEATRIEEMFGDEFDDLDFELVLCAFEATHKLAFTDKLVEATLNDYGQMSIEDFLDRYLNPREQHDPLFVSKRLIMFRDAMEDAYNAPEEDREL